MIKEQLQAAIRNSGLSQSEIARRSGVPQPNISEFLADKKDFTLETAGDICKVLQFVLAPIDRVMPEPSKKTKGK